MFVTKGFTGSAVFHLHPERKEIMSMIRTRHSMRWCRVVAVILVVLALFDRLALYKTWTIALPLVGAVVLFAISVWGSTILSEKLSFTEQEYTRLAVLLEKDLTQLCGMDQDRLREICNGRLWDLAREYKTKGGSAFSTMMELFNYCKHLRLPILPDYTKYLDNPDTSRVFS